MSRAGEVWGGNSAMESFFSSLKTERTAKKVYRSREQARADVFDYIERFYNPTRRHSTLGYVSPIEFEKAQEAEVSVHDSGSSPICCSLYSVRFLFHERWKRAWRARFRLGGHCLWLRSSLRLRRLR